MSLLAAYRKKHDLTLEAVAEAVGLSRASASWISEIERGVRDASANLALMIEVWSQNEVPAHSVSKKVAGIRGEPWPPKAAAEPEAAIA